MSNLFHENKLALNSIVLVVHQTLGQMHYFAYQILWKKEGYRKIWCVTEHCPVEILPGVIGWMQKSKFSLANIST